MEYFLPLVFGRLEAAAPGPSGVIAKNVGEREIVSVSIVSLAKMLLPTAPWLTPGQGRAGPAGATGRKAWGTGANETPKLGNCRPSGNLCSQSFRSSGLVTVTCVGTAGWAGNS